MNEKPTNSDPYLDSRNFGKVSKSDMEWVNKLRTAKRTHFTHFMGVKMPWHTDDHRFGESIDKVAGEVGGAVGDEGDADRDANDSEQAPTSEQDLHAPDVGAWKFRESTVFSVDGGRCSKCRGKASYGFRGKLYCSNCWNEFREDNG